jgi:hypothetical protein
MEILDRLEGRRRLNSAERGRAIVAAKNPARTSERVVDVERSMAVIEKGQQFLPTTIRALKI